ncbi:hypothetical protein [Burkholderia vietnamiensis]|uniref:hypothetical protein n=1 Tax=Burkholderia vietnamiensis TaxID=60552 RepID=UPI000AB5CFA3|nr:hypothetical protein [Burkholderia vietnamiensis]
MSKELLKRGTALWRQCAFHFMRYGDWSEDDEPIIVDGKLQGIRRPKQSCHRLRSKNVTSPVGIDWETENFRKFIGLSVAQ